MNGAAATIAKTPVTSVLAAGEMPRRRRFGRVRRSKSSAVSARSVQPQRSHAGSRIVGPSAERHHPQKTQW
jgi:hypothetical protein